MPSRVYLESAMPEPTAPAATRPISARKQLLRELSDRFAARRDEFIARNRAFHEDDRRYLKFLIPPGQNVLEIGCGTGGLLAASGPFDAIVLADTIGMLDDCQATLAGLHPLCHRDTRLIVAYHNYLWEPVLRLAEKTGLRMPEPLTNWLRHADIANLLDLADFRPVREEWRQLIPKRLL